MWNITSYDKAARGVLLRRHAPDVVILDECHYLKTPDAKRTLAIYGDGHAQRGLLDIPVIWGLSGTPAPNHAGEYYTHLRAFGLTTLTHWQFLNRFCVVSQTPFGYRVGANRRETLPELRALLSRMMSRRTQASVWTQTPEPFWSIRTLTPTTKDAEKLRRLDAILDPDRPGDMSKERRLLGLLKVPYVVAHVQDLLVQGRVPKVLIGAWHYDVIDQLRTALQTFDPIVVVGDTTDRMRWQLIDRFQTASACRVAIIQVKTGGVGINLSSAAHVVMAEPSWSVGDDEQFVQRPQHVARTIPLPVDLIALDGSMDETILRSNVRKRRMKTEITGEASVLRPSGIVPSLDALLGMDAPTIFLDDL